MVAIMTPSELAQKLAGSPPPRLLDVREPWEFQRAALPQARLIPVDDLPARVAELNDWREEEIIVYCHHGIRSAHAIAFLRGMGFLHLHNLTGGIDRWSVEVDPETPRY